MSGAVLQRVTKSDGELDYQGNIAAQRGLTFTESAEMFLDKAQL